MNKLIKLDQVLTMTGLSRSSIYESIKEGKFPAQVNLGARSVAWVANEIEEWMTSCIANRSN